MNLYFIFNRPKALQNSRLEIQLWGYVISCVMFSLPKSPRKLKIFLKKMKIDVSLRKSSASVSVRVKIMPVQRKGFLQKNCESMGLRVNLLLENVADAQQAKCSCPGEGGSDKIATAMGYRGRKQF